METKLSGITTQYHTFVDNQVLTSKQLNQFISYFDGQDRLSRVLLTGTGIVCGFKIIAGQENKWLTITQGVGITTDGDLVTLQNDTGKSSLKSIDLKEMKYTHYLPFDDKSAGYGFFRKTVMEAGEQTEKVIDLYELFPSEVDKAEPLENLNNFQNKVVLLYIEAYRKTGNLCTTIDCDNQGIEQVSRLRVLLVSQQDAAYIASKDSIFSKHNVFEFFLSLPKIHTRKIVLSGENSGSLEMLKKSYYDAIKSETLTRLKNGLSTIFNLFKINPATDAINDLFNFSSSTVPSDFQYRFDVLNDLTCSYNEIRELLLHTHVECFPSNAAFPKHLLLGEISGNEDFPSFRHRFYNSAATGNAYRILQKVKHLLERVQLQVTSFHKELKANEIKIIPSKITGELGETAIPIYYGSNAAIREVWSFEMSGNLSAKQNFGYHFVQPFTETNAQNPLVQNNSKCDFYRIEGQLGMDYSAAVAAITKLIKVYGLDFEFVHFDFDNESQQFQMMAKNEPSLEHRAGVPKGGTFVLIASKNKIVADFALGYRYKKEADLFCCTIRECSYPWISSLKYLNNLTRSQKGTKKFKVIPKNYKLQILEYRINETSFVKGIETIEVPMKQIAKRRMHAITDALNLRYPQGLVFDFNESQKRFVITCSGKDKFLLRVRDATMSNSSPVYAYSQTGMLKNNRTHRTDAMICREIIRYNSEFYKRLHNEFAPLKKDDDYGMYYRKWAEWESLIDELRKLNRPKRIFKDTSEMPDNIKRLLTSVKNDFSKITSGIKMKLDGDWVNGTWVNEEMLKQSTAAGDDAVSRFIQLRKLLHNKTGVSKLSVYIYNKSYRPEYDGLIEKYDKTVDFYFTTPTGPNVKEI